MDKKSQVCQLHLSHGIFQHYNHLLACALRDLTGKTKVLFVFVLSKVQWREGGYDVIGDISSAFWESGDAGMEKWDYCSRVGYIRLFAHKHTYTKYLSLPVFLSLSPFVHTVSLPMPSLFFIAVYCIRTIAKLVWLKSQCIPPCAPLSFKRQSLPFFFTGKPGAYSLPTLFTFVF